MKNILEKMPLDWQELPLKEGATFLRRGKSPKYVDKNEGLLVIGQNCIRWNTIELYKAKFHKIPHLQADEFLLKDNDILINSTGTGTIGRVNQWKSGLPNAVSDSHVTVIRTSKKIDAGYLRYFLSSELGQRYLEAICFTGSTNQIELSKRYLSRMPLPCPNEVKEQALIAGVISRVDQVIDLVEKSITSTERLKTSIMQNLLIGKLKHDDNWRREDEFHIDGKFGLVPKGWEVVKFGKLFDIISGKGFTFSEYSDVGTRLVKIDNVGWSKILWKNITYLPDSYIEEYPKLVLNKGDILLALNRPITQNKLKIALLKEQDAPSILYQRVGKVLFLKEDTDHVFAYYHLSRFLFDFIRKMSVGSDQPFINVSTLRKQRIVFPKCSIEQKAIGEKIQAIDEIIEQKHEKLSKLMTLKKSLMQKLLTGKVRIDINKINNILKEEAHG